MINSIHIKMKNQDEIIFPECRFENADRFVSIYTIEDNFMVGAFSTSDLEYVYYDCEKEQAHDKQRDFVRQWI